MQENHRESYIPYVSVQGTSVFQPLSSRLDEGIRKRVLPHHRPPKPLATIIY